MCDFTAAAAAEPSLRRRRHRRIIKTARVIVIIILYTISCTRMRFKYPATLDRRLQLQPSLMLLTAPQNHGSFRQYITCALMLVMRRTPIIRYNTRRTLHTRTPAAVDVVLCGLYNIISKFWPATAVRFWAARTLFWNAGHTCPHNAPTTTIRIIRARSIVSTLTPPPPCARVRVLHVCVP